MQTYQYLLIGGGMAADSAARGIRQVDPSGSIGMLCREADPPYNRPPLSKGLLKGRPISRIWRKTDTLGVDLHLGRQAVSLDHALKRVTDDQGETYAYTKLLLATGGDPIRIPGASERVIYYRTLADFRRLQSLLQSGQNFVVIGGGFIGSEITDALVSNGKQVTMLFLEDGICARILPPQLSQLLTARYREKGVRVMPNQKVDAIEDRGGKTILRLASGEEILAAGVIAGLGIRPNLDLARQAGLALDAGILVDSSLCTSNADIFAAGDVTAFYTTALGKHMRAEHEEHANLSGLAAGQNMAGANPPVVYDFLPSFYSELFGIKYDAVGELNPAFNTFIDWEEPERLGAVYYLQEERVRGVLLWNKGYKFLDPARQLIAAPGPFTPENLIGQLR